MHLAELEHWLQAQAHGEYGRSARGAVLAEAGFIHGSSPQQLPAVVGFIHEDFTAELVVLEQKGPAIEAAGIEK